MKNDERIVNKLIGSYADPHCDEISIASLKKLLHQPFIQLNMFRIVTNVNNIEQLLRELDRILRERPTINHADIRAAVSSCFGTNTTASDGVIHVPEANYHALMTVINASGNDHDNVTFKGKI